VPHNPAAAECAAATVTIARDVMAFVCPDSENALELAGNVSEVIE